MNNLIADVVNSVYSDSTPTQSSNGSIDYGGILSAAAERHGISDKLPILQKILSVESGGKVNAKSPKGASGLMQLMPKTARSLGVKNIFDPYENIDAGVRYFKDQLNSFGGDDSLALAAYNAGPGAVKKYGGIPPYKETRAYVKKIMGQPQNTQTQSQALQSTAQNPSDAFTNTINTVLDNDIAYGSGRQSKYFQDWKQDNCGGFTTCVINEGLKTLGVPSNDLLPASNLGTGQPAYLNKKFGSPLQKGNFTVQGLQDMGAGTVIAGTRPNGVTHAEIIIQDPNSDRLFVASYGRRGKTLQFKQIDEKYVAKLNAGKFQATNPFPYISGDTSMMVAGPGAPQPSEASKAQQAERKQVVDQFMAPMEQGKEVAPTQILTETMGGNGELPLMPMLDTQGANNQGGGLLQSALNLLSSPAQAAENPQGKMLKDVMKQVYGSEYTPQAPTVKKLTQQPTKTQQMQLDGKNINIQVPNESGRNFRTQIPVNAGGKQVNIRLPFAEQTEAPSLSTITKAAMVDDPESKFKIFAHARFPNDPNAWKNYFIKDGDIFYADKGVIKREMPGTYAGGAQRMLGETLGHAPENLAAGAGLLMGGSLGAGAGASIGSLIRQEAAKDFLGDKPKSTGNEFLKAAGEGTLALLGGLAGKGLVGTQDYALNKAARTGMLGKVMQQYNDKATLDEVEKWAALSNKYGIKLTVAEITNSPTLQGLFQMLSTVGGTAKEKIAIFQKSVRTPEILSAIQKELGQISSEESIFNAGQMARNAASDIEKKLVGNMKSTASPIYQRAIATSEPIDVKPIIAKIDAAYENYSPGGLERQYLNKIKSFFVGDDGELITNPAQVKSARDNINKLINGTYDFSLPAAKNIINRESVIIKNLTSAQLYKGSEDFKIADTTMARLAKPVNEFIYGSQNKPTGSSTKTLAKRLSAIINEEQFEKIPEMVFKESPQSILNLKKYFIDNGYQDEWNALVRAKLQSSFNNLRDSKANNEMGLVGENFANAAWSKLKDVNKFKIALDPDQFKSLNDFMSLLRQTGKIVYNNSQTTPMHQLIKSVEETPVGAKDIPVVIFDKYANLHDLIFNPSRLRDRYQAKRLVEKGDAIYEAMMNPKYNERLISIKRTPNNMAKVEKFIGMYGGLIGHEIFSKPNDTIKSQD